MLLPISTYYKPSTYYRALPISTCHSALPPGTWTWPALAAPEAGRGRRRRRGRARCPLGRGRDRRRWRRKLAAVGAGAGDGHTSGRAVLYARPALTSKRSCICPPAAAMPLSWHGPARDYLTRPARARPSGPAPTLPVIQQNHGKCTET